MKPYLSVIIPAYNESKRIPLTLVSVDKILSEKDYTYEILVVDDGSTDNTAGIVKKMAETIKNLKVVDNPQNRGKGAVVRQGMLLAQGEYRLFMDADNATTVDHFDPMIPFFKEGYGIVFSSRAHRESVLEPAEPWYRQIPGKLGNIIIQILLVPGVWDTQCGFKAFSAKAAENIFGRLKVDRWGFDAEALAIGRALGYKMKQLPVHWVNTEGSHISAKAYLQVLLETLKIRWWLWTDAYQLRKSAP